MTDQHIIAAIEALGKRIADLELDNHLLEHENARLKADQTKAADAPAIKYTVTHDGITHIV